MAGHTRPTKPKATVSVATYLYEKNPRHHLISSRDIDDQIILQSDWTRTFYPITCEPEFSQIWGLNRKIENQKIFDLDNLQHKLMTKFSKNFTKPNFRPILPTL